MSSNAESHSQLIEIVEKPHYFMATVGAASSAEEAIQAFLFYIWPRLHYGMVEKIKMEGFSCNGLKNLVEVSLSKACHSSKVIYTRRWCD